MADSKSTLPLMTLVRPVPAWGRVKKALANETEAAFATRFALAALDAVGRAIVQAGAWPEHLELVHP